METNAQKLVRFIRIHLGQTHVVLNQMNIGRKVCSDVRLNEHGLVEVLLGSSWFSIWSVLKIDKTRH